MVYKLDSSNLTLFKLLHRLWFHINSIRRKQFKILLILMLLSSFFEILSIGAVFPFLAILTQPQSISSLPLLHPLTEVFNLKDSSKILLVITIAFCSASLLSGFFRILLLKYSAELSFNTGADLSHIIFRNTLYQNYSFHLRQNSSEIISGISSKANTIIYSIIGPFLTLIVSVVMFFLILLTIFSIEPLIALFIFFCFGTLYSFIAYLSRKQLKTNSTIVSYQSNQIIKLLQEGLGSIRDVLINNAQEIYCKLYSEADLPMRNAQARILFVSVSPRYLMEAIGMFIIGLLAYFFAKEPNGIIKAVPILGTLAIGAQRLLPNLQQIYNSWAQITGSYSSLKDVIYFLDQPMLDYAKKPHYKKISFKESINLKHINFKYKDKLTFALKEINLTIHKGSRIGFMGSTGSGKSTLLDIVMSLIKPSNGSLIIDNQLINEENMRGWQDHIAHVPQAIFLADASIEENIAFGVPTSQINKSRVRAAAKKAQISRDIELWPGKYQTIVGERGIRLSGGQRQRIAIARALYKKADVIVFDEATSALDIKTEEEVMSAIEKLNKNLTIIIVAHRLSTLRKCSQVVELSKGSIKSIKKYRDIINYDNIPKKK